MKLDGRKAGVQGESRSKILRLTFSPEWKDLEKSILWQDARGETVVRVPLVPTSAEINEYGGLRIDTKIPGEALAYAGECAFTVTGYDLTDSARTLSAETVMQVEENELAGKEAVNAQDPTPDAVEQLQNAVTKAANDVARFAAAAENSALESRDYMNAATDASLAAEASKKAAASSESEAANWASVAGQCASRSADSLTLVLAAQADVAQDKNEAKAAKAAAETAAEEAKQAKAAAESAKSQASASAESAAASSTSVAAAVQAAQKAADDAAQAARDAKAAADSVQDVSADAEAAKAAAQAATQAMVAADNARLAAEAAARTAAGDAAANVENRLKQYVSDAQSAKGAAEQAAENAATEAVRQAESKLAGYVTDAENAKSAAQSAAGTAATDATNAVNSQLAQHVADAQAAQKAAEQARDEAQAIAGGDFMERTTYDPQGKAQDVFAYADKKLPLAGGKLTGKLNGTEANFTGAFHNGTVDYNVAKFSTTTTVDEIVIKTTIPVWGTGMPLVHLKGYAFGEQSPVEMNIAFYCPGNGTFSSAGCTSTSPWKPTVKLSKWKYGLGQYDEYVAVSIIGSIYYPRFVVDVVDIWEERTRQYKDWTVEYRVAGSGDSIVPQDALITVPYKAIANDIIGNSSTATKLATARNINGVPFDGTSDIIVVPAEPVPISLGGTDAASAEDARNNLGAEKAGAAQLVFDKIISKKDQLIVNGSASLADNTGISALRFDGSQAYFSRGSFTYDNGKMVYFFCDDFFEIDPRKSYEFSFDLKSKNGVAKMYSFLTFFDADHNEIWQQNYHFRTGSTTKLAKDLVAGDTVVYLEDVSGWSKEWQLGTLLTVWNYKNSFGYQYAPETYTRNYYPISRSGQYPTDDAIDHANNTVKLQTAYSGATIPAGTYVSQGYDGNGWGYKPCQNTIAPTEWTHFSAVIDPDYIRPGTVFTKYGFFWNDRSEDDQVWGTNFVLKELSDSVTTAEMNTAISNAVGSINTVLDEINGEVV